MKEFERSERRASAPQRLCDIEDRPVTVADPLDREAMDVVEGAGLMKRMPSTRAGQQDHRAA